jgi:hypothetical protein
MPYVTRPRWARRGLTAVFGTLAACGALPALASADCAATPSAKVFAPFGDNALYSLVSNGGFESGTGGWTLTKSSVVSGNETWKVRNSKDSKSLAVQSLGAAVSPAFCVGIEHPSFRLFARRTSNTWGVLNVSLLWTDAGGKVHNDYVGALAGDDYVTWRPTHVMPLGLALPLWQSKTTLSVRLVFDPEDMGGNWAIDDVYIDPYSR